MHSEHTYIHRRKPFCDGFLNLNKSYYIVWLDGIPRKSHKIIYFSLLSDLDFIPILNSSCQFEIMIALKRTFWPNKNL